MEQQDIISLRSVGLNSNGFHAITRVQIWLSMNLGCELLFGIRGQHFEFPEKAESNFPLYCVPLFQNVAVHSGLQ